MRNVLFDIEANAKEAHLVTEVWSLVMLDLDTDELVSLSPEDDQADWNFRLVQLAEADRRVGHNILGYDLPVLGLRFDPEADMDTLVMARLARPDLKGHSLEVWGERLGVPKGDPGTYERWTPQMQTYCEQDVNVNLALYQHLLGGHAWL